MSNEWRRPSACHDTNCPEVLAGDGAVLIRNSVEPTVVVGFTHEEWSLFIHGVKKGEFDAPK